MKKLLFALTLLLAVLAVCAVTGCTKECNHQWNNGVVTKQATCTENGVKVYACTACKTTKTEDVPALGHVCESKTRVGHKGASCAEEGYDRYVCDRCSEKYDVVIPKDTNHSFTTKTTKAPTCAEPGVKATACMFCGLVKSTEEIPATGEHEYASATLITVEPTPSASGVAVAYCKTCTKTRSFDYSYASYSNSVTTAQAVINGFSSAEFGGTNYSSMPVKTATNTIPALSTSHPRILINETSLNTLKATIADNYYINIWQGVLKDAAGTTDGTLEKTGKTNTSTGTLQGIASTALLYQLTGTDLYAYDAIKMMKQYLTTWECVGGGDVTRVYGELMFYTAIVYDWCYDKLTETDKAQFITGVEKICCVGMEVGFPPSGQGSVAGHGSERQILRDYLSFAIAIYNEDPTWYNYVAARMVDEYIPVRNEYYKSNYTPQGVSCYASIRFSSDLWSAWLLETATGTNPYSANMANVMTNIFSRFLPGDKTFFREGDDETDRTTAARELDTTQERIRQFALAGLLSYHLFDDTTAGAWTKYADEMLGDNYTGSLFELLAYSGTTKAEKESRYDGMDLITYTAGFEAAIVARNSWDSNQAAVFMKIGNKTTSNHDHADAGSFQIYYGAMLAADTGMYDTYNSTHWAKYHQSTVAHNSIVFYSTSGQTLGQRRPGESTYVDVWFEDSRFKTGVTTGVSYGYGSDGTTPTYAYIAGDISNAYEDSTATYVERRMLTVFDTNNADAPMYFFVYDNMTSNSTYRKAFLLHAAAEPSVSGNQVVLKNGTGKLVLQNMTGDAITGVEGYSVSGNIVDTNEDCVTSKGTKITDGQWGRVEISPATGSANDIMLNAMYVTAGSKNLSLTATSIREENVEGAVLGNVAAVFTTGTQRQSSAFSFVAEGAGELTYYVSGVAAGTWTITAGGKNITATATEEGGLLVFTAPTGFVSLTR